MHFYAHEYSEALRRTITFQDIPVEPWRQGLLKRGLPVHLVDHRAGRYDRMSDDGTEAIERAGVCQEKRSDI